MPTNTYVALDKVTVGTATPSITFSSIPQGYTDLVLIINAGTSDASEQDCLIRVNGDTGSNYSATYLYGTGSSAASGRNANQTESTAGYPIRPTLISTLIVQFPNYSNTTTYKNWLGRANSADSMVYTHISLWRNTNAINTILLYPSNSKNFLAGSTFTLYGIASASVGAKATGGIISSDSQYYYHTFLSSGTFTPNQSLTCDYLVVAGGGGGGSNDGGGGGAGGLRSTVGATGGGGSLESALSLTAQAYAVTVGGGGAGGFETRGSSGNNSVFSTITSTGGGGGGGAGNLSGLNGGSGGGGSEPSNQGTGTTNQGYAGEGNSDGGGGGGAGEIGGSDGTGQGGDGVATSISGSSVTYGGGGGGRVGTTAAAGGSGGGGAGSGNTETPVNGTANLGGGGGGGRVVNTGGSGGSGIVIVRYAK
jgi:hypothetical protein